MTAQGNQDRRDGVPAGSPGMRSRGDAHPVGTAVAQGLVFGLLFGVIFALTSHHSVGSDAGGAAIFAVVFGLAMWVVSTVRRRRAGHA